MKYMVRAGSMREAVARAQELWLAEKRRKARFREERDRLLVKELPPAPVVVVPPQVVVHAHIQLPDSIELKPFPVNVHPTPVEIKNVLPPMTVSLPPAMISNVVEVSPTPVNVSPTPVRVDNRVEVRGPDETETEVVQRDKGTDLVRKTVQRHRYRERMAVVRKAKKPPRPLRSKLR